MASPQPAGNPVSERRDYRKEVTEFIIQMLEQGGPVAETLGCGDGRPPGRALQPHFEQSISGRECHLPDGVSDP
jgi:hypothetical protein